MEKTYTPPRNFLLICILMMLAGVAAIAYGLAGNPSGTWPLLLFNNMFFITLSMGGLLFYSIQFITGSSWSAQIIRIPLAMGSFLPVAGLLMLLLYFGLPHIYEWAQPGITETDKLIAHKAPFLNVPFYMIRLVVYFVLWVFLFYKMSALARKEDREGGQQTYLKTKKIAAIFIFVAVLSFSMAAIDWIMTIDAHWYSTLFGFRAMVTSMYYATAFIVLVLLILGRSGLFPKLGKAHLHDLARYLFRFSIVFGYLWFMQFLIIWYANIPELTVYYSPRFLGDWQVLFYIEPLINFAIPFVVLMADAPGRKPIVLFSISSLLILGLWISLFLQIMPGSKGEMQIGLVEVFAWVGYAGLFLFLFAKSLSGRMLIPENHPMIEESFHHHL